MQKNLESVVTNMPTIKNNIKLLNVSCLALAYQSIALFPKTSQFSY